MLTSWPFTSSSSCSFRCKSPKDRHNVFFSLWWSRLHITTFPASSPTAIHMRLPCSPSSWSPKDKHSMSSDSAASPGLSKTIFNTCLAALGQNVLPAVDGQGCGTRTVRHLFACVRARTDTTREPYPSKVLSMALCQQPSSSRAPILVSRETGKS